MEHVLYERSSPARSAAVAYRLLWQGIQGGPLTRRRGHRSFDTEVAGDIVKVIRRREMNWLDNSVFPKRATRASPGRGEDGFEARYNFDNELIHHRIRRTEKAEQRATQQDDSKNR